MSGLDILIVSILLLCAALGVATGFVLQAAGIVSVIAGIVAILVLGPFVADALGRWFDNPDITILIAYILLFASVTILVRVGAAFCSTLLAKLKLKRYDRMLGGILGAVKGFAICAVLAVTYNAYGTNPEWAQSSILLHPVLAVADWVMDKAEEHEVTDKVKETGARLRDSAAGVGETFRESPDPDAPPPPPPPSPDWRNNSR